MDFSPRKWWSGLLDVERLAWESVMASQAGAQELAQSRGQRLGFSTTPSLVSAAFGAGEYLRINGERPDVWTKWSGFFAASNGWVRLHGNYPHHQNAIRSALSVKHSEDIGPAVAGLSAAEVEQRITEARGIAVAVRTQAQWAAHPHQISTADQPWVLSSVVGGLPPLARGELPMSGIRVLDLTRVIAGPTCSQLLACLGGDVLRVDHPDRPELLSQFLSNGMGKRSTAADLGHPDQRAAFEQVLSSADVVLLGYRRGSLDRFGLNPTELLRRHPDLIVATLSAWGECGPWGNRPGFDSIVQAACGIADRCSAAGVPGALPVQALDHATGYQMAARVMKCLARRQSGIVQFSLLGAARKLLSFPEFDGSNHLHPKVIRVRVDSPHGHLDAVPPPLLINGHTIERSPGRYSGSALHWEQR